MDLVQFDSGHLMNTSIIRAVTPVFVLMRERKLHVSAGVGIEKSAYGVFIDTEYFVDAEWSAEFTTPDGGVSDMMVGRRKTSIGLTSEDINSFLSSRADELSLDEEHVRKIRANLARISQYHEQIASYNGTFEDVSLGDSPSVDSPSLETLVAQLNHRVTSFNSFLSNVDDGPGLLSIKESKPVNGFFELSDRVAKLGFTLSEESIASLRDFPLTFISTGRD